MWGFLALLWRQISSKAFPPSAINPPSHLPSALHLVHFCCHSDYFLSIPFPLHSQRITIALPACSQFLPATCSLFSYPVSPCCSTLQSSPSPNYAFFLKFSFANLHFNFASSFHCSKLPFFSPLLTTSQQFPALASSVLRNRQPHPLPSQCPERGRSWEHSSTQSPVLHCSSPGHYHRKLRSAQSWRKASGQSKLLRNQTLTSKSHPTKFRLHFSKTATR